MSSTVTLQIDHLPRLRWACRRGMLELDVLLSNFLDGAYASLSDEEKHQFVDLLNGTDPELFAWLMGHEVPPTQFETIVTLIRQHAKSRF